MDIQEGIKTIMKGQDLSREDASSVMKQILTGSTSEAQIKNFLVALSTKGESVDEVIGSAEVMRTLSTKVSVNTKHLVDTCGTGGVASGIFNVSTTAAFVASSCGAKVAKHETVVQPERVVVLIYWKLLELPWILNLTKLKNVLKM